jgi:hypothetical protein
VACGHKKFLEIQGLGAAVWGTEVYTDHSVVCLAAQHHTGSDGGLFLLTLEPAVQEYHGTDQHGVTSIALRHSIAIGRSFTIVRAEYPFKLDKDGDGRVDEAEADAAGRAVFKGIPALSSIQVTRAMTEDIDTDGDLSLTSKEVLAWSAMQLHVTQHDEM